MIESLCLYLFVYLQPYCVTLDFKLFIDSIHILLLLYLLLWFWDSTIKTLQDFIKIYGALIKDIFLQPAAMHTPTAPLTAEQPYVVAAALLTDGGESLVHHHGPANSADSIKVPQRDTPQLWHATVRERPRVRDAGCGAPPSRPQQGEALVLQAAGYQAILHVHAGGYRSHILAGGCWTVCHGTARQGAFVPSVNWQQEPTQAYYVTADPWPQAVLLHTISAPNKQQEPGRANPPTLVWSPDQEEHLRDAGQVDAMRATDVPDLHAGPITHARPAATLAVAQRGQQNPQWVVCMFSLADAHIAVCDPEHLPGPEAVIRVADCARVIIKVLQEGDHHAPLLQVRLKDNAKAAKPGVWPEAAHPADLELGLAVRTTVCNCLQAFHDLRWRGKPDRQIGATHWQEWLQADEQRDAVQGLGPAPATRALDGSASGHALAPHTVPLANLPFDAVPEGRHLQFGAAPSGMGGHKTNEVPPMCGKVLQKRGDAGTPGVARGARRRPSGRQGGDLPHPPGAGMEIPVASPVRSAPPPPSQAAGHAAAPVEEGEASEAAPGAGSAAHQGSISARLAPLTPLGPPWERAPHTPWPRHTPGTWLPQQTPRHCQQGTADSGRTRRATPYGSSPGTCATASTHRTNPSGTHSDDARGRLPVPIRSTSSPACCPRRGALPSRSRSHLGFYEVQKSQNQLRCELNFKLHLMMQFSMNINHFHSLKRNNSVAALKQPFQTQMCSFNASIPRKFDFCRWN